MALTTLTAPYASTEDYRKAKGGLSAKDDGLIEQQLIGISRYIDGCLQPGYSSSFFGKDTTVQSRIYYPQRAGRTLWVDSIASTAGLVIKADYAMNGLFTDETAWAVTDYQLKPLNAALGPEVTPWDQIYIPLWSTQALFVPQIEVQVTAIWGWPSVPIAVSMACIELTAIWRIEGPRSTSQMTDLGAVLSVTPAARNIIDSLLATYSGRVTF